MVNFYRRFMPNAAEVIEPLFKATSGNPKPNAALEWTHELSSANQDQKSVNTRHRLELPGERRPDIIDTLSLDAFDVAAGAVLEQQIDGP